MKKRTVFQSVAQKQRHLVSTSPQTSVCIAAGIMTKANCGSVLVLDPAGALVGILTERDLMTRVVARARDPEKTLVADVMTRSPHCVPPETHVDEAVLVMLERGFRHLPIISTDSKILGVFSIRDALPREIHTAESLAEFHEQLNDALG